MAGTIPADCDIWFYSFHFIGRKRLFLMQISIQTINISDVLQPGNIIAWLVVGLIAGGLAGMLVRGRGFGCLGNIVVGLIGSFIGATLASALNWGGQFKFCGSVFVSLLGAVIFVALLQLVTGGSRRN
jgi:uncharacterized membrane protein YeaQ/YmgE (transglycosylase-associated protein family)